MKISAGNVIELGAPIAQVERHTGLSKDILRTWEKRYGFPQPQRDVHGDRRYSAREIAKLQLVKRLIDGGHRPRRLVHHSLEDLEALARRMARGAAASAAVPREMSECLEFVRRHDGEGLRNALAQRLIDSGLSSFVRDFVAPVTQLVGEAWAQGEVDIAQEHLYSRAVQVVLHGALGALPTRVQSPSLVMSTVPGEAHALGLLMAEVMFALSRCACLSLGVESPIEEIARAAAARRADAVALSFSAVLPVGQLRRAIVQLRGLLAPSCEVWIGGSHPALALCIEPGVRAIASLEAIPQVVAQWRERSLAVLTSA